MKRSKFINKEEMMAQPSPESQIPRSSEQEDDVRLLLAAEKKKTKVLKQGLREEIAQRQNSQTEVARLEARLKALLGEVNQLNERNTELYQTNLRLEELTADQSTHLKVAQKVKTVGRVEKDHVLEMLETQNLLRG